MEKLHERQKLVQEYAARVLRDAARPSVVRSDGSIDITINEAARASVDEVDSIKSCVMPEVGEFAKALNWRSPRGCGLKPEESYTLRAADGAIIAKVVRNCIPAEMTVGWLDIENHHKEHADLWCLGCEAEPDTNLQRTAAAFKHSKGAAGYRIQKGMTVHEFGPRAGDTSNKLVVTYTNRDGRVIKDFGIGGCPIERHHHSEKSISLLHQTRPTAGCLLDCLEKVYTQHVTDFMEQKCFPPEVCAHAHASPLHIITCPRKPSTLLGYPSGHLKGVD